MKDKFVKIIFGKSSGYYNDFQYKIKEVNIAKRFCAELLEENRNASRNH